MVHELSASIPSDLFESIAVIQFEPLSKDEHKTSVVPIGTESNVMIVQKDKVIVTQMYGMKKMVDRIYIYVDKPHEFGNECMDRFKQFT